MPRTVPRSPGVLTAVRQRLLAQGLTARRWTRPEDVVGWFGAVQAQEYGPARWALGLRLEGVGDAAVAAAFDEGRLLRTHVLRPTWHFATPADLRWLLALTGPRIDRAMAPYDRRMDIDAPLISKARRIFERALTVNADLTRAELADALATDGIIATTQRLAHLVMHAELDGVVCSGPRRGKQFTYALLDRRVPAVAAIDAEQALEMLVRRFFRSHGPATVRDFNWWCGLRMTEATRVLTHLRVPSLDIDGLRYWWIEPDEGGPSAIPAVIPAPHVHLLPIYDEYTVAYRDRVLVPHGDPQAANGALRGVVFQHALVIDGLIAGTWRADGTAASPAIAIHPVRRLSAAERAGVTAAAAGYERFLGRSVRVRIVPVSAR